jgi:hypothetical protein
MADIRCDFCTDNLAAFIVGNVETGEQTFACAPDFARLGLVIAAATLPPSEIDDASIKAQARVIAPTEAPSNGEPKSKPKRRRATRTDSPDATAAAVAPKPAAAEDS